MKKLVWILFLLVSSTAIGQKQFLVEYDRIKNSEKYFELINAKGNLQELPINKPNLKKGDLVKFRVVNMNPLVFTFDVNTETKDFQSNSYSSNVISGFSGVMGKMNGAFGGVSDELSNLSYSTPDIPSFRGGSKLDEARQTSLINLSNFHTTLKKSYMLLAEYQKAIESVYSTELTKAEISEQLKGALANFKLQDYNIQLRKLEEDYELIKNDSLIFDNEKYELDSSYQTLIAEIETTLASPNNGDDLLLLIENSNFSAEKTMVIGYQQSSYGNGDFDDLDDAGFINYSIHFRGHNEINSDYKYDNLLQDHDIELSVQAKSNFSWASGLIIVSPFNGFKNYSIEEIGYDSLKVNNGSAISNTRFTLGTNLIYNFQTKANLIPQAIFGISIGLGGSSSMDKPINFLFGGGIKVKQFPFLSLTGGLSLCQNNKLKNGFEAGNTYLQSSNINSIESITEKTFSPGYFFGININL